MSELTEKLSELAFFTIYFGYGVYRIGLGFHFI